MADSESSSKGLEFTRETVDALAGRLADADLTPNERELLLAIFAAARDNVSVRIPPESSGGLKEKLIQAFVPDDLYSIQQGDWQSRISPGIIKGAGIIGNIIEE